MTNVQINAAIAEACGWTEIHDSGPCHHHKLWGYPPELPGQCGNAYNYIPDYCNDLNATREAEKVLNERQYIDYMMQLYEWLAKKRLGSRHIFNTPARQRAEAFLRALGKWATTEDCSVVREEVQK